MILLVLFLIRDLMASEVKLLPESWTTLIMITYNYFLIDETEV